MIQINLKSMLRFFIFLQFLLFSGCSFSDTNDDKKPKLVVAVVVDQMRYDYLTRLSSKFSDDGFNRLVNEGFNCLDNHFNYVNM